MKNAIAVIDSSCVIGLLHLNLLHRLNWQYNIIYVPNNVRKEISRKPAERNKLKKLINKYGITKCDAYDSTSLKLLSVDEHIGAGEAEAIIQAREKSAGTVFIDEKKARKIAERHGLQTKGILGLLLDLKRIGEIKKIKPLILKLQQQSFRFDQALYNKILQQADEDA